MSQVSYQHFEIEVAADSLLVWWLPGIRKPLERLRRPFEISLVAPYAANCLREGQIQAGYGDHVLFPYYSLRHAPPRKFLIDDTLGRYKCSMLNSK